MKRTMWMTVGALLGLGLMSGSARAADGDGDGIDDKVDNCSDCYNPAQLDTDHDGFGDCWRCDVCNGPGDDQDWDRVCSLVDNCPNDWDASQADGDHDGVGDICDDCPTVYGEPWADGCPDTDLSPDTETADTGADTGTGPADTGTGPAVEEPTDTGTGEPIVVDPYIRDHCRPMPAVFSALTSDVVAHLVDVLDDGFEQRPNVFMVIGDSLSDLGGLSAWYLGNCGYPHGVVESTYGWVGIKDLRCYPELTNGVDHFLTGRIGTGTVTSFTRDSLAAKAGQNAVWALTGKPSPVQKEINAINPQYAVIMFGSNDIYGIPAVGGEARINAVANNILAIVDVLLDQGIIPIVMSSLTRTGYDVQLGILAARLRTAAAAYKIPFVDFYAAAWPLPGHGHGSDGQHPDPSDYNRMCVFTSADLQYGCNLHNLVTLKVLDDLYEALR